MDGVARRFLTSREACDRASYSRPDSLLRAWRKAGLPVYQRVSGRNLVALDDFAKFIQREAVSETGRSQQAHEEREAVIEG